MTESSSQEFLAFLPDLIEAVKTPKKSASRKKKTKTSEENLQGSEVIETPVVKTVAPNNTLNDLTGAEWKFSTKSVINKPYPVNMQHKLRSQHGGQKPPQLCADLIHTAERFMELSDRLSDLGDADFSIFLAIHNPETSTDVFGSFNSAVILQAEQK